ncbi:integration host factor, actinobacterial type [Bounagaea algeriensis]
MSLPTLTADQRDAALQAAARTRTARRDALDALRAGELTLPELLEQAETDPDVLGGIRLRTALLALSGVGAATADGVLDRCGIARTRRLRGLGTRQRAVLVAWVGRHVD